MHQYDEDGAVGIKELFYYKINKIIFERISIE